MRKSGINSDHQFPLRYARSEAGESIWEVVIPKAFEFQLAEAKVEASAYKTTTNQTTHFASLPSSEFGNTGILAKLQVIPSNDQPEDKLGLLHIIEEAFWSSYAYCKQAIINLFIAL